jgi:hypothetical protein
MDPEELAWKEYQRLEEEFLCISEYSHLANEHLGVYSYKLMNLLVAIGVEFDGVSNALLTKWLLQKLLKDQTLHSELKEKQTSGAFFNMGDYRKTFEQPPFLASTRCVTVNRLNLVLHPFQPPPQSEQSLGWWGAFTSLKHDRIANFVKSATMSNALNGLAALLLANLFFRSDGVAVEFPGLEPSRLFSIKFLLVNAREMGVGKTIYKIKT